MGFRVVRQTDSMNCGAAAMAMLCAHYRCNVSRQEIDRMCVPTIQGISIKGLRDVAETLGFEAYSTARRLLQLSEEPTGIRHMTDNKHRQAKEKAPDRHSEKVQRLLGAMPRGLGLLGIAVTLFIFIALLLAVCLIPYPLSHGESILAHILG